MRIILFFFVLSLLLSCRHKNKIDPKALALNQRVNKIFFKNLGNKDSLNYALLLADSAINLQSSYVNFYFTKLMILKQLNDYEKMLPVYDRILTLQNNTLTLLAKGATFEHLNNLDSATYYFLLALHKIDETKWRNNLEKEYFRTILYGINGDTIDFNSNKERIKQRFSDEKEFSIMYQTLDQFNRKDYIDGL